MRRALPLVFFLLLAAPARGDGGPIEAVQGGAGVSTPGGDLHYVAVGTRHRTIVQRVRRSTGAVDRWTSLRGSWGIPSVSYDGSTTGLSADGETLVLARDTVRYPPRRSRFAIFAPRRMRVQSRFALRGFFTVDAISPDARWIYFTHYTSARDFSRYEVRAYDLARSRLVRDPVVDPREPDEAMGGTGITRVSSADGRWAYTLYLRPRGEPFIHALDTARRSAACIDLDDLSGADLSGADLTLTGPTLRLTTALGPQALIDTRSRTVRPPGLPLLSQAATTAGSFNLAL